MSETETKERTRGAECRLDFDEEKLWRGELGPNVAEEFRSK